MMWILGGVLSCFQIPNFFIHVLVGKIYLITVEEYRSYPEPSDGSTGSTAESREKANSIFRCLVAKHSLPLQVLFRENLSILWVIGKKC